MRRLAFVLAVVGAIMALVAGNANAVITAHYGHRDIYYTSNGNITTPQSSDADVRVGIEIRYLDNQSFDAIMVVQVLDAWNVDKVCAVRSALHINTSTTPVAISGDVPTNCTAVDRGGSVESSTPNKYVKAGSRTFQARGRFEIWGNGCGCGWERIEISNPTQPIWALA
jgi:hypothetical protein